MTSNNKSTNGGWLVREGVTYDQALLNAIKVSDVRHIPTQSISGFLFKMTVPTNSSFRSELVSVFPGLNPVIRARTVAKNHNNL